MSLNPLKPSTSMQEDPRVITVDPTFVVGTFGRHLIMVWRRELNLFGLSLGSRAVAELQKQHPGQRLNVLVYIEPEGIFPDSPSTFAAFVEALRRFEESLAAVALVYNREGFWNATMRGRMTALFNESKTGVAYAIHPTLPAAIEWLCENGAPDIEGHPQALARAVDLVRGA